VAFSGDVGRFDAVLSRDPVLAPKPTSGDRKHLRNRSHAALPVLDQLEGVLKRTFARGGVLLIPAFAVGRSQADAVADGRAGDAGRMRPFPVHVDSPMAIDATRIYAAHPDGSKPSLQAIGGAAPSTRSGCTCTAAAPSRRRSNEMKGPA